MASTVLTSWALLIWQTLHEKGIDPRPLFKNAKLDPAKLGDGNARYKVEKIYTLWALVEEITEDPCIGLEIGKHWNITTFHALGVAFLASGSLKEGIGRVSRYARLVNNAVNVALSQEGPYYHFTFFSKAEPHFAHPVANDASQVALLKMCKMLWGQEFRPLEVHAFGPPTSCSAKLESHFECACIPGAEKNFWILDRHDVEKSLPTGNPELAQLNEQLAIKYLTTIDKQDIVSRAKHTISELLPSGDITEALVAQALNMSVRSLQRHLAAESLSFSSLLNSIREELAETYIRNSQLSINEISYLLGFSEPASFTRAFRRWQGTTPSARRNKVAIAI
jgi:AraC-like DNA-binding protein